MPVCLGSTAVEMGEKTLVWSEYSAGTVTGRFWPSRPSHKGFIVVHQGRRHKFFRIEKFHPLWLL